MPGTGSVVSYFNLHQSPKLTVLGLADVRRRFACTAALDPQLTSRYRSTPTSATASPRTSPPTCVGCDLSARAHSPSSPLISLHLLVLPDYNYPEDFARMKYLGMNAHSFSFAWTRILPLASGDVNQAGLDFYNRFIDSMVSNGLEPIATLFHWDSVSLRPLVSKRRARSSCSPRASGTTSELGCSLGDLVDSMLTDLRHTADGRHDRVRRHRRHGGSLRTGLRQLRQHHPSSLRQQGQDLGHLQRARSVLLADRRTSLQPHVRPSSFSVLGPLADALPQLPRGHQQDQRAIPLRLQPSSRAWRDLPPLPRPHRPGRAAQGRSDGVQERR